MTNISFVKKIKLFIVPKEFDNINRRKIEINTNTQKANRHRFNYKISKGLVSFIIFFVLEGKIPP